MVRYIIILFILFFASCSNLTLETDQLEIKSIGNGAQLTVGDSFTISIDSKDSDVIPTKMDIQIANIDSVSRDATSVDPVVFEVNLLENPEVELVIDKEFADGLYLLKIDVSDEEGSIQTDEIEFSVFSGEISKDIQGALPSKGLYTNSKVILQSRISSKDVDPYLVWSHHGEVIGQGYLSNGHDQVLWDSKDFLGFNEIKLDIFPYKFKENKVSTSNLIFSTVVNDITKDVFDEENYYKAHLFNGNYIDEEDKYLIIEAAGEIKPKVVDNFYGLEILDGDGFLTNKSFIPYNEEGLLNNSIIIELLFLNTQNGIVFTDTFGSFVNSLFIDDSELRFSQVLDEVEVLNIPLFKPEPNTINKLVVTTILHEEGYRLFFYNNGELLESVGLNNELNLPDSQGSSLQFGGIEEPGAEFLIDSFKVYIYDTFPIKRNNVYQGIFSDYYGEAALGSGFNSLYLPENVEGDASIDGEVLTLAPGSTLGLGHYLQDQESYNLDINVTDPMKYKLGILSEGDPLEVEVLSGISLRRKGENLFIGSDKYTIQSKNIVLKAIDELRIDSIVIQTRENLE